MEGCLENWCVIWNKKTLDSLKMIQTNHKLGGCGCIVKGQWGGVIPLNIPTIKAYSCWNISTFLSLIFKGRIEYYQAWWDGRRRRQRVAWPDIRKKNQKKSSSCLREQKYTTLYLLFILCKHHFEIKLHVVESTYLRLTV